MDWDSVSICKSVYIKQYVEKNILLCLKKIVLEEKKAFRCK